MPNSEEVSPCFFCLFLITSPPVSTFAMEKGELLFADVDLDDASDVAIVEVSESSELNDGEMEKLRESRGLDGGHSVVVTTIVCYLLHLKYFLTSKTAFSWVLALRYFAGCHICQGGLFWPILQFYVSESCTSKCDIFPQRKKEKKVHFCTVRWFFGDCWVWLEEHSTPLWWIWWLQRGAGWSSTRHL